MTNVLLAKVNNTDITIWSTSLLVLGILLAIIGTILFVVTVDLNDNMN